MKNEWLERKVINIKWLDEEYQIFSKVEKKRISFSEWLEKKHIFRARDFK